MKDLKTSSKLKFLEFESIDRCIKTKQLFGVIGSAAICWTLNECCSAFDSGFRFQNSSGELVFK